MCFKPVHEMEEKTLKYFNISSTLILVKHKCQFELVSTGGVNNTAGKVLNYYSINY